MYQNVLFQIYGYVIILPYFKDVPWFFLPPQTTPASSEWRQLCWPSWLWMHSKRDVSLPSHCTSSIHICPDPWPKAALFRPATAVMYPSCRHTTIAAFRFQKSSHTVPHCPATKTSTRPDEFEDPSTSRISSVLFSVSESFGNLIVFLNHYWPLAS